MDLRLAVRMVATWNVKARRWLDGRRGLMDKVRTALEVRKAQ
jgi:hypothetical protein